MDGYYLNNLQSYEKKMQSWITKMIAGRLWEKFNDLHIDEIESDIKNSKDVWADLSLFLFKSLMTLIDTKEYNVLLVISLSYSRQKTELSALNWKTIKEGMDLTPPSFYLFPKGESNYNETIKNAQFLIELSKEINYSVYYKEDLEDEEYSRFIYIKPLLS